MISAEDADLWSVIERAKAMAQGLHLHGEDENALCGGVVSLPMLHGAAAHNQKFFESRTYKVSMHYPSVEAVR